jgi:hypothetical protein
MNTNSQLHTELIVSCHFDLPLVIVLVGVLIVASIATIIVARKRQKP